MVSHMPYQQATKLADLPGAVSRGEACDLAHLIEVEHRRHLMAAVLERRTRGVHALPAMQATLQARSLIF